MNYVIGRCFNDRNGKYLVIGYKKCYYTDNSSLKGIKLNQKELQDLISTLLEESYVQVGKMIFNQIKGIPMGSKSSAILCDLSLISVEHQYLLKPIYRPIQAVRYQDDILVFNYPEFIEIYDKIYPSELELEADNNETGCNVNYLDTKLTIENNRIIRALYDKRDSFNFEINSLFRNGSNIRNSLINNVCYAQTIRICKITNKYEGLLAALIRLRTQIIKNGFNEEVLYKSVRKLGNRRIELLHRFMNRCEDKKSFINKLKNHLRNI